MGVYDACLKPDVDKVELAEWDELRQTALVEIVVHAATDAERRAALAAIVNAYVDAIEADPTLGDTVSFWEVVELQRDNLAETGVPNIKGATLTIAAEFIADRPV